MDGYSPETQYRHPEIWTRAAGHASAPGHIERRGALRRRILKKGKLLHPNNRSVFDCVIRDISETGARLSCQDTGMLPNELRLMFFAIREVRYVRVIWRRPGELGVAFLTAPNPASHLQV